MKKVIEVDAYIEDELRDKQVIKNLLKIPYKFQVQEQQENKKALRVFKTQGNEVTIYASERTGTLVKTDGGYEVDVTGFIAAVTGKQYTLVETGTAKVLQTGKISMKKAESNVYEFKKTVNTKN